jgi:hypothetical protein
MAMIQDPQNPVGAAAQSAADKLNRAVETPLQTLRGTPAQIAALLVARRKAIVAANGDTMISDLARRQKIANATQTANDELDRLDAAAVSALDAIHAAIASATASVTAASDPSLQVLAELQAQAAWHRAQARLANGADVSSIIQEAAARGDRATLDALKRELPAHVDPSGGDRTRQRMLSDWLDMIATVEGPTLNAAERAARTIMDEVTPGSMGVRGAFNYAREELNGRYQPGYIPGWVKGQAQEVSDQLPALFDRPEKGDAGYGDRPGAPRGK